MNPCRYGQGMVLQAKVKLEPKCREPATPTSPGIFSRLKSRLTSLSSSNDIPEHTGVRHVNSNASGLSIDDQNQTSNGTSVKR